MSDDTTERASRSCVMMPVTILRADITGSTSLYDRHGDVVARDAVTRCLDILRDRTEHNHGRMVTTIGDEVMCIFDDPTRAVLAAHQMHSGVREASQAGHFSVGAMRIKIGLHHGPALVSKEDVTGDNAILTAQVIKLAKPDQILTTRETLLSLPPEMRPAARFVEEAWLTGRQEQIEIYELVWEVTGLTQVSTGTPRAPRVVHERLILSYGGSDVSVTADQPEALVGRLPDNDLMVDQAVVSRKHARFSYRRGRFIITDMSANGTVVERADGRRVTIRRESLTLEGSGRIGLGATFEESPDAVVTYACE